MSAKGPDSDGLFHISLSYATIEKLDALGIDCDNPDDISNWIEEQLS